MTSKASGNKHHGLADVAMTRPKSKLRLRKRKEIARGLRSERFEKLDAVYAEALAKIS